MFLSSTGIAFYRGEWTCDEIAECLQGVNGSTYAELWSHVVSHERSTDPTKSARLYLGEVWSLLSEESKVNIRASVRAEDKRFNAMWKLEEQERKERNK